MAVFERVLALIFFCWFSLLMVYKYSLYQAVNGVSQALPVLVLVNPDKFVSLILNGTFLKYSHMSSGSYFQGTFDKYYQAAFR